MVAEIIADGFHSLRAVHVLLGVSGQWGGFWTMRGVSGQWWGFLDNGGGFRTMRFPWGFLDNEGGFLDNEGVSGQLK